MHSPVDSVCNRCQNNRATIMCTGVPNAKPNGISIQPIERHK